MALRRLPRAIGSLALALVLAVAAPSSSGAATITVDATADDADLPPNGNCTLREAILAANQNSAVDGCVAGDPAPTVDLVVVPPGTYVLSIGPRGDGLGEHGDLDLIDDIEVRGAGADQTLIDADGIDRVFDVAGGVVATIGDLELAGGDAASGDGGGVENDGDLLLEGVALVGNQSQGPGAGVRNNGTLFVRASTFSGNSTDDHGGGIDNHGTATLENSTFSGNDGGNQGGGLYNLSARSMSVVHCTVVGNTAGSGDALHNAGSLTAANSLLVGSCSGSVDVSGGGNLEGPGDTCGLGGSDLVAVADVMLSPLLDNGGPTRTHALQAGSAAIDFAAPGECLATDQRGVARPQDGDGDGSADCDSGAFEADATGDLVFADGYESGDTGAWSSVTG